MIKEINKPKELPHIAVKFANVVFLFCFVVSILVSFYSIIKIIYNPLYIEDKYYYTLLIFGIISAIFFLLGLKINNNLKINVSLIILSSVITIYIFEIFLDNSLKALFYIYKTNVVIDKRNKLEVIDDLNKEYNHTIAYPAIFPSSFTYSNGIDSIGGKIFPIGGISNVKTIVCNENGYWSMYDSDEYGFNNPKGLYEENTIDILMTGNSYIEGQCVKPEETITAILRKKNYKTINLGKGGNTTLIELAGLKEYAVKVRPKVVVMYLHHNIGGLNYEKIDTKSSIMFKYLNDQNFTQNLLLRQNEIDIALKNYVNNETEEIRRKINLGEKTNIQRFKLEGNYLKFITKLIKLTNLRSKLNFTPVYNNKFSSENLEVYEKYLRESKRLVSSWGGVLYLVYIPTCANVKYSPSYNNIDNNIVDIIGMLNIPIINIYSEIIENHPDPMSLYPFRTCAHNNAKGYKLIAEKIIQRLKKDNAL